MNTEHHVTRQDVVWNMGGSTASAIASAIMVLGVTRIAGAVSGGVFSIAFSTAQMLMMLGNYGIRTYQVSDAKERFSFGDYFWNRILTCAMMMICSLLWCVLLRYDLQKSAVVLLVSACRMVEAFADVLEGRMHQQYHLALAGKSLALRTCCYSLAFFTALVVTRDPCLIRCGHVGDDTALRGLLYDPAAAWIQPRIRKGNLRQYRSPAKDVFSRSFVSMFLLMYNVNTPKYAIDSLGTEQEQACYAILYLPAQGDCAIFHLHL